MEMYGFETPISWIWGTRFHGFQLLRISDLAIGACIDIGPYLTHSSTPIRSISTVSLVVLLQGISRYRDLGTSQIYGFGTS